jgi:thioredoxin reductase/polyferredoxin
MNLFARYTRWLHTRWPAGGVEKLPLVKEDGTTNIPGVYIVGDLRGIPLLKFAADGGARAVQHIMADESFRRADLKTDPAKTVLDLVIIGAGISGMSAALEAKYAGMSFEIIESSEPFATIINFPKGKPIYTYPKDMIPEGDLHFSADVKEPLLEELEAQTLARGIRPTRARAQKINQRDGVLEVNLGDQPSLLACRVIVALGRSGDFRKLNIQGEDLDKVYNRLHDPNDFCGQNVLVAGGGDSALETAIALAQCGSKVTLSYRKKEFARPKSDNIDAIDKLAAPAGSTALTLKMETEIGEIKPEEVTLKHKDDPDETISNDVVFTMIGREAPLDFFRRSRLHVAGDWDALKLIGLLSFFSFCVALYNWKSGGALGSLFYANGWFPASLTTTFADAAANPASLLGTLVISAAGPAFWYTLAYCVIVVLFGFKRIRRRNTPYIKTQTLTLMTIQVLPLFLLPEIILPLLGHNGLLWQPLADALFPVVDYGHGREYWRAYGLILAWPLNVYNVFTNSPLGWWLIISFAQTCVLIPAGIYFWGKGVYCGWICSCGALAETLGDTHRHKMPHGPRWNRLNMVGQVILLITVLILALRIYGWVTGGDTVERLFLFSKDKYKWIVDVFLAGAVGYGVYFWFSGRVWCRFMCPLAALMHIYARFSRFRILADKKKCISCNICTSVCHQGIDIMSFANKGMPMEDPECVRCSACVHSCPTGVLTFGRVDRQGRTSSRDRLAASPVQLKES